MVKPPPTAKVVQAESVNQVTVPVESELAVKGTPPAGALIGLPKASWSCTVITPAAPGQAPAVKVRDGVMNTSCGLSKGTMAKALLVAEVRPGELAWSV